MENNLLTGKAIIISEKADIESVGIRDAFAVNAAGVTSEHRLCN